MTVAPGSGKPDSPNVNLFPPIIFVICLAAGIVVQFWLRSGPLIVPRAAALYAGIAVAVAGLLFQGLGLMGFKRRGVDVRTNRPASSLVTGDAHRFSRNPMYVGFVVILAGIGIAADSLPMLLAAIPMFLYLDWLVIPREERYLSRAFGEDYEAYCRTVRRWL